PPLRGERTGIRDAADVAELVRVDDAADRPHAPAGDVQREDADDPVFGVAHHGARQAVHLPALEAQAELPHLLAEAREEARDAVRANDRRLPLRRLPAAIAVDGDVLGEDLDRKSVV